LPSQFEPPNGTKLLRAWRDELAAAGLAPKTRRNYLNVLDQVLRHAAARSWLRSLPVKPRPTLTEETLTSPDAPWYAETDFRAPRAGLYEGSEDARAGCEGSPTASPAYRAGDIPELRVTRGCVTRPPGRRARLPDFGSYWRANRR
jgi:hypothetical protein